jgi:hypothetical protein
MSIPKRMPVSCSGEICAVADPTRVNHAPESIPQATSPTIVAAVPIFGGVQNANMTIAVMNPTVPKTFHTPTRSLTIPVMMRPTNEPACVIATVYCVMFVGTLLDLARLSALKYGVRRLAVSSKR